MTFYQSLILRGGVLIVLLTLLAAAGAGTELTGFSVEAGTDVLLNQKDRELAYYNDSRADWGTDEYVIVCCHRNEGWFTLEAITLLNEFIQKLKTLPHAKSITAITTVPLLRIRPVGLFPVPVFLVDKEGNVDPKIDLEKARAELLHHTQARGNLISDDGKDLSILVYLDVPEPIVKYEAERNRALARMKDDAQAAARFREVDPLYQEGIQEENRRRLLLVNGIRDLARAWGPRFDEPLRLSGLPLINVVLREHIKADIVTFGILAFAVFSLTFLLIYRRWRWVVLPILSCVLPVVLMLGIMVATGRKVTVITSNMPVLLFVLTLPYAVYYIERYLERRAADPVEPAPETSTRATLEIWSPCLYSCLATMVGTAAHIPSGINPVSVFGVMMTIGMAIALGVIMLFLPSLVARLPGVPAAHRGVSSEPRGPLRGLLALVLRAPGWVLGASLLILGLSIWGTFRIRVETKFIDYFRTKSEIYQGLDYIDNRMGGTTPLEVHLKSPTPGFFKTAEGLAALGAVERFFDPSNVPETGNVRSLKTLVDEVRKAFTDKEGKARAKDLQLLGFVIGAAKGTVREFCNEDFTVSRVLIRMKETAPTLNRNRILARLQEHLDSLREKELKGLEARKTGVFLLYANMLNTLIINTKETFALAVGGIWLMLVVLFRSPLLSTMVLLPQVLPVFLVLGVMGFTGIALDMVTVIIASVAMGVGIDAAIQYTVRFKAELAKTGGDIPEAIRRSHATIGRAILIATSIVFAGFVMLAFSQFIPTVYFGVFTGLAILMGLFASLTTLPSTFLLLRYPRQKR
jgi:predicted RND superfamily exporter protein